MKRIWMAAAVAALTLAMSLPALADRRHDGYSQWQQRHEYRDHRADHGKHRYRSKHHYKAKHRHRGRHHAGPRRHRVEHHYYYSDAPRHRGHRRDAVPLVTLEGFPLLRLHLDR